MLLTLINTGTFRNPSFKIKVHWGGMFNSFLVPAIEHRYQHPVQGSCFIDEFNRREVIVMHEILSFVPGDICFCARVDSEQRKVWEARLDFLIPHLQDPVLIYKRDLRVRELWTLH